MSNKPVSSSRRRLLTKLFAFLAIVSYDIHSGIIVSTKQHADEKKSADAPTQNIHIHTIHNAPQTIANDTIKISFQLHHPSDVPFRDLYAPTHGCTLGKLPTGDVRTGEIPPTLLLGGNLQHPGRVLDFTTTISTSLKILHMGDSLTIQISEATDEMMGAYELQSRTQLWEAWKGADGGTITAPTNGGGINGGWRLTALWHKAAQGMSDLRNTPGGGWNYHRVNRFLHHEYTYQGKSVKVDKIDAVTFRVMHGWMSVEQITRERIIEAATMAHDILGAETFIFLTVPFTNNVQDAATYAGVAKINEMILDVAQTWHLEHDTNLLVLDYNMYSQHVIWTNAINMGYNVTSPLGAHYKVFDNEGPNFLLERLKQDVWPPSIPHACHKLPTPESGGRYCERNILFKDGMHFCTETMAARIGAGIACLLGCVYNKRATVDEHTSTTAENKAARVSRIKSCERQCNDQFMSVLPVKNSWINATKASFS